LCQSVKKQLKEEDKKAEEFKKQGQSMIDYMKSEQEKLLKQKESIKADQKVLEQQTDLLKQKSDEIAKNFSSLKTWVDKKQAIIKQHEASDQKCRHRYLPKYRQDMADRNQHCAAEYRVKEMYRKKLKKIVKEIESKSSDPKLVQEIQRYMKDCKKELKSIPSLPIPDGLAERL
jgi:monoamine oxidase